MTTDEPMYAALAIEKRDALAQSLMEVFSGRPVHRRNVWAGMWRMADHVQSLLDAMRAERDAARKAHDMAMRERDAALEKLLASDTAFAAVRAELGIALRTTKAERDAAGEKLYQEQREHALTLEANAALGEEGTRLRAERDAALELGKWICEGCHKHACMAGEIVTDCERCKRIVGEAERDAALAQVAALRSELDRLHGNLNHAMMGGPTLTCACPAGTVLADTRAAAEAYTAELVRRAAGRPLWDLSNTDEREEREQLADDAERMADMLSHAGFPTVSGEYADALLEPMRDIVLHYERLVKIRRAENEREGLK